MFKVTINTVFSGLRNKVKPNSITDKCLRITEIADSFSFSNDVNYKLVNKAPKPFFKNKEFKHIYYVLKSLGVEELDIGNNIELARQLKSAIIEVKKAGFEVPTRIRCESIHFDRSKKVQNTLKKAKSNEIVEVPGSVCNDHYGDPILYLNTSLRWKNHESILSKSIDPRHTIWHETCHWLQVKNNNQEIKDMDFMKLSSIEKRLVNKYIGAYAADSCPSETVAEIFACLMSNKSCNSMHPGILNIYKKYYGPVFKSS